MRYGSGSSSEETKAMNMPDSEDVLAQELKDAIHAGDIQTAQNIVVQMASQHVKLKIDIQQEQKDDAVEKPFRITVQVEDRESAGASFDLHVRSTDKIEELKKKVRYKFNFPEEVQRWIIGKRIREDSATLAKCDVRSATTVFLYLLPAHSIGLTRKPGHEGYEDDNVDMNGSMQTSQNTVSRIYEALSDINNELLASGSRSSKPHLLDGDEPGTGFVNSDGAEDSDKDAKQTISTWICVYCNYENRLGREVCYLCHRNKVPDDIPEETGAVGGGVQEVPLRIGDRVAWPTDMGQEKGTVRWIGMLSDMEGGQMTVGVEFDNKVGVGTGMYKDKRLFHTKEDHAALVPVNGLLKVEDIV